MLGEPRDQLEELTIEPGQPCERSSGIGLAPALHMDEVQLDAVDAAP